MLRRRKIRTPLFFYNTSAQGQIARINIATLAQRQR
jgi:hypothetical protein